jgi:UDP-N-acetylmuramate--alanine ligase
MNLNQIHNVFYRHWWHWYECFSRYFKNIGKKFLDMINTTELKRLSGINIHFEDRIDLIPEEFYPENTFMIVTPPKTHLG